MLIKLATLYLFYYYTKEINKSIAHTQSSWLLSNEKLKLELEGISTENKEASLEESNCQWPAV